MKLRRIQESHWTIYAACNARGDDAIEAAKFPRGALSALLVMIERASNDPRGFQVFPDNRCHALGGGIFQISFGRIWRMAYFVDEGQVVILAGGYPKRAGDGTVDPKLLKRLERARNDYFEAKQAGRIEVVSEEE